VKVFISKRRVSLMHVLTIIQGQVLMQCIKSKIVHSLKCLK